MLVDVRDRTLSPTDFAACPTYKSQALEARAPKASPGRFPSTTLSLLSLSQRVNPEVANLSSYMPYLGVKTSDDLGDPPSYGSVALLSYASSTSL
ncbi:hypothetical protein NUW54_g5947 [Trametes sanguinea]|uniref:Uncharacterized protein n=1 Tax=Trametes sanguinea TaxID=158606 RepID=A0ACC1PU61_9APHY|nr:hypothetical protein NUW54_g5947 [Trametes sanguinea]